MPLAVVETVSNSGTSRQRLFPETSAMSFFEHVPFFVICWICCAHGRSLEVPGVYPNLGAALAIAGPADSIRLAPGEYSGDDNCDLVVAVADISILGSGANVTKIDCLGNSRCLSGLHFIFFLLLADCCQKKKSCL